MENDVGRSGTFRAVTLVAVVLVAAVLYMSRGRFSFRLRSRSC